MRAVLVSDTGTADVLQVADADRPSPGPGQVLVQVAVAGGNYMDVSASCSPRSCGCAAAG